MDIERLKNSGTWYGRPEGAPYDIGHRLRKSIVENVADILAYDGRDHNDDIREVSACYVDSHTYRETRDDWSGTGYPEPHHFDGWDLDELTGGISDRQKLGTALALTEWTASLFAGCDDRQEALELAQAYLADIGPDKERCEECANHCHA